jgi:hypothetical protein
MNTITRNFVIGATLLVLASFIFLVAETKGRLIENPAGIVGAVVVVVMLFLSYFLLNNPNSNIDKNDSDTK